MNNMKNILHVFNDNTMEICELYENTDEEYLKEYMNSLWILDIDLYRKLKSERIKYNKISEKSITYIKNTCKKYIYSNKYKKDIITLNLENNNLKEIPTNIHCSVKNLFLDNNNIKEIKNINKNIRVLSLCKNKLEKIDRKDILNIKELNVKYNIIKELKFDVFSNLDRIDISNNELTYLPSMNVSTLICSNNKIKKLGKNYPNLITFICKNNLLKEINSEMNNIRYIECFENNISYIRGYTTLKNLLCQSNRIKSIGKCENLKELICFQNKIKSLEYYKKLNFLMCDDDNIMIPKDYSIETINLYKNDNKTKSYIEVFFKTDN